MVYQVELEILYCIIPSLSHNSQNSLQERSGQVLYLTGFSFLVQSGGRFGVGGGLGLPLYHGFPVLTFFFVKLFFPLRFRFFAVFANVAAFEAARAVAAFNVIVELAMRFGGNLVAIDDCF
jgi:hypothetical protein